MKNIVVIAVLAAAGSGWAGEVLPIDPLWQSAEFRKAFTASYGIDARIEPRLSSDEKAVLDGVAEEMADGDRDGAVVKLTGSSLLGESPALIFSLGNLRFEQGRLEDAVENFQKAVGLYPNFRDAHRNLAVALVQGGEFGKAEPHLRRSIELGAADGVTFGLLGYCHAMAGRHQAALQAYRRAQLTMPEETQWLVGEAQALTALNDHEAAESLFVGLLQQRPTDFGLWLRQADVWMRSDEPEKAIANLEMVWRMGLLPAGELASLGHLYLEQGLPDRALGCYREALTGGEVAAVMDGLDYLCGYRHFSQASDLAAKLADRREIAAEPKSLGKLERARALIDLQSESGDAAAGVARVTALLDRDPLDGEALLLLADHHASNGGREVAAMLLERAAKVDDNRAEALMSHGRLLVEDREYAAGLTLIEQSLALQPRAGLEEYVAALRRFAEDARR